MVLFLLGNVIYVFFIKVYMVLFLFDNVI